MSEMVSTTGKQSLDEVMLAMDVVDTLRHHVKMVEHELDADVRDAQLKEKLRKIYRTQGIEVPDHVLEEGVRALREDRFSYHPPQKGLARRLAILYINRRRWGKWLIGILVTVLLAVGVYQFLVAGPQSALPDRINNSYQATWASAKSEKAKNIVKRIGHQADAAVASGDTKKMKLDLAQLAQLQQLLAQEYKLQVVARPGERSGIWRIPDVNRSAKNYYIIVEALAPDGTIVEVPVINEETGKQEMVTRWGLRVDESVFQQVADDKRDDGIIQNNILGSKRFGYLLPDYTVKTSGRAITSW